jgi:hypothetical protein
VSEAQTTKTTETQHIAHGRKLNVHEREILIVLMEECLEVGKEAMDVGIKASKLLRFGADDTNPTTELINTDELNVEMGHLMIMMERVSSLGGIWRHEKYVEGCQRKTEQLAKFLQTRPIPRICVLAGNNVEYIHWLSKHPEYLLEAFYVGDTSYLLGREFDVIEVVGTFWERADASKIHEAAKSRLRVKS